MELTFSLSTEQITELAKQVAEINNSAKKPVFIEKSENYTCKEVAAMTKLSKATIQRHCDSGIIEAAKPGKSWIITSQSLNKYLGKNE